MRVERHSLVIPLQDDVDGSRDRVGTVNWRTADDDGFDPINELCVDYVEIDLVAALTRRTEDRRRVRPNETTAVDEGERPFRPQPEEVDEILARAEATGLPAHWAASRHTECGKLIQRLTKRFKAAGLDLR